MSKCAWRLQRGIHKGTLTPCNSGQRLMVGAVGVFPTTIRVRKRGHLEKGFFQQGPTSIEMSEILLESLERTESVEKQ